MKRLLLLIAGIVFVFSTVEAQEICIYYFFGAGCPACARISSYLDEIEKRYPEVEIHRLEIWYNQSNRELFFQFCEFYCIDERFVPMIFIGEKFMVGPREIVENLEREIIDCSVLGCPCPYEKIKNATFAAMPELRVAAIVTAAIADSVNPCVLAIMIFLLIYLTSISGTKRRILKVALAYIGVVYLTYFLAGFGIFAAVQEAGVISLFYRAAAGVAIGFGLLNLKEFFFYGKGPSLRIPRKVKPMIEKFVRRASVPSAMILGFAATIFELPCTGGPYLLILAMLANELTRLAAIPYLLLYNLIFVLPLFLILALAYKGFSLEEIERWRKERRKFLRLIIGLVTIGLGSIMLLELI
jgi:cytochrome c biogenesis protein CcdA/glutaredoxin